MSRCSPPPVTLAGRLLSFLPFIVEAESEGGGSSYSWEVWGLLRSRQFTREVAEALEQRGGDGVALLEP